MAIQGPVQFTGVAACHAAIELRDADGNAIASTTADDAGEWAIKAVDLPAGLHAIHAVATSVGGRENISPVIDVEVDSLEASAERLCDRFNPHVGEYDTSIQSSVIGTPWTLQIYEDMVRAVLNGFEVDSQAGERVLRLAGKTFEDFESDVGYEIELRGIHREEAYLQKMNDLTLWGARWREANT